MTLFADDELLCWQIRSMCRHWVWLKHLETPGLLFGILSHLVSPSKEPPLSDQDLTLFESDLRIFLHIQSDDMGKILCVDAGQPSA